jgi:hypothetical protein
LRVLASLNISGLRHRQQRSLANRLACTSRNDSCNQGPRTQHWTSNSTGCSELQVHHGPGSWHAALPDPDTGTGRHQLCCTPQVMCTTGAFAAPSNNIFPTTAAALCQHQDGSASHVIHCTAFSPARGRDHRCVHMYKPCPPADTQISSPTVPNNYQGCHHGHVPVCCADKHPSSLAVLYVPTTYCRHCPQHCPLMGSSCCCTPQTPACHTIADETFASGNNPPAAAAAPAAQPSPPLTSWC